MGKAVHVHAQGKGKVERSPAELPPATSTNLQAKRFGGRMRARCGQRPWVCNAMHSAARARLPRLFLQRFSPRGHHSSSSSSTWPQVANPLPCSAWSMMEKAPPVRLHCLSCIPSWKSDHLWGQEQQQCCWLVGLLLLPVLSRVSVNMDCLLTSATQRTSRPRYLHTKEWQQHNPVATTPSSARVAHAGSNAVDGDEQRLTQPWVLGVRTRTPQHLHLQQ